MNRPNGRQLKKEIRSKVQELGNSDISVKYDGSYHVKVKKLIPLSKVQEIAEQYESYRTCQASGEILSGGNTFVFVDYMTWNTNKNEPFSIEIEDSLIEEIKNILLSYMGESWKQGDSRSRSYHIRQAIKENCSYFKDWSQEDVSQTMSILEKNCEELYSWINGNFQPLEKYSFLNSCHA